MATSRVGHSGFRRAALGAARVVGWWAAVVALGLVQVGAGCGQDGAAPAGDGEVVRGYVIEVKARSLVEIEALRIEDAEGVVWELSGRGYRGVSPSHLRQHMLEGAPVAVTYREEVGELRIHEVTDYVPGATPAPHGDGD